MLRTLATPTLLEEQDGIVLGVRSPSGPTWTIFARPFGIRVFGIGLPQHCSARDCKGRKKANIKHSFNKWGDGGQVLVVKCRHCKVRSENCRPPPASEIEGHPDVLKWKWPLTEQEWGWFKSDPKNNSPTPLRILSF